MDMTNTNKAARELASLRNGYYLKSIGDVFALIGRYQWLMTRPGEMQTEVIRRAFA